MAVRSMSGRWATSPRRQQLPPNWATLRRAILERDQYRCRIAGPHCTGAATEVDHIGDPHDHGPANLRAACVPCHKVRTQEQAQAARGVGPARRRQPDQHPGRLKP